MEEKAPSQIETLTDVSEDDQNLKESTCLKKWNEPLVKRRLAYTVTLYFAVFMYGWVVAIKGPSLLDLQEITQTDTLGGASFFTSAAVGSVVGAFVGGIAYDRFNKQLTLFLSVLLFSLTCAVIPYCTSYWSMVGIFFLNEFLIGGFKTGSNVEILSLWGYDSKRFMQGYHLCFSLGASLSPLVIQPFLSDDASSPFNQTVFVDVSVNSSTGILEQSTLIPNSVVNNVSGWSVSNFLDPKVKTIPNLSRTTRINIPYIIAGCLVAVSALGLLVRYFYDKRCPLPNEAQLMTSKHHPHFPRWAVIVVLILFLFLYFFLDEVEDSSPSFLATFVVQGLGWDKADGARVTSAFWASFTVGRLVGTISITFLTHFQFFIICSCCLLISQTGLLLSGLFHVNIGIWLSIILAGMSIAVVLPASLTWMEKEFVSVSGKIMSVIYMALSLGGMANPQLIGYMMQHVTYLSYCYILLVETLFFVLTLAALKVFLEKVLKRYSPAVTPNVDVNSVCDCETSNCSGQ